MKRSIKRPCAVGVTLVFAAATVAGTAACGSSNSGTASTKSTGGTFELWDPFPQYKDDSSWVKVIKGCGEQVGVTINRTGVETTELNKNLLLTSQQGNAPDIAIVDNPNVSSLGETGVLATTAVSKMDTSTSAPNLLDAGKVGDKTYGIPLGANSLALFYNKDLLTKAGIDPAAIKDWSSLNAALGKAKAAGKRPMTLSAVGTEEGTFQFLPWFWGSRAKLTKLDSPEAASALQLWKDWLTLGYISNDVIGTNQVTAWKEFAKGDVAFNENGTWNIGSAKTVGFEVGVIPIPSAAGGTAPAPTGGEFFTMPVQKKTDRYATTTKIVACLTKSENLLSLDNALSYIAPNKAMQETQMTTSPELKVWVEAVQASKPRTGDNLGSDKYSKISQGLWTAIQAVMSGAQKPSEALTAAQTVVGSAS
jgi:multiple sugar transport system substrate-binding protein